MDNYNCLDLNIIKKNISEYASILEAKTFICDESVPFNPLLIKYNCVQTSEALELLKKDKVLNFDGIKNINDLLEKADKNVILSGLELKDILVFHNHCVRVKKYFDSIDEELTLRDYSDSINVNEAAFDKVNKCIDNNGEVKEDASEKLKEINYQINKIEKDIYDKAYQFIDRQSSSLQEKAVYLRNNRITFLFKNADKNKFNGYQYGSSSSGLATYVEPQMFIDMNNTKIKLLEDKNDEINRILLELTYLVSSISASYTNNFDSLMKLCVVFAKAKFGYYKNAIIPKFTEENFFDIRDLCHPLIDENKVISNSYRLFKPYKGIVISGSNTGGKTVSLKAIALSIIMSYLGIPVICSKATIPFYKNIFVDIDDNQSIVDSLSTFSAHITNINYILNNADEKSLILIDELISGTDPKEAQAISLAILDKIKEIGASFIITTHFDDIKKYSFDDPEILLSSVGFDFESLKPTYKYLEDSVGSSNAIEIASRYFDDKNIISKAKSYINKNKSQQDQLMDKLSKQIEENEIEKQKIDELKNNLNLLSNQMDEKLKTFENEKEVLKKKYLDDLNNELDLIKQKALDKLESIKDKKDEVIIKQIDSLMIENKEIEKHEFVIGDTVRINDNEQLGTITEIDKDKVTVNIRGITVKTKLKDLTFIPVKKSKKISNNTKHYARVSTEINLVGQRVEDGLILFEEYLDKANAANMSQVKIIHGIGTGALRSAIRNRLKKISYVKSFKDGDYYDGGSAVTMVEFK